MSRKTTRRAKILTEMSNVLMAKAGRLMANFAHLARRRWLWVLIILFAGAAVVAIWRFARPQFAGRVVNEASGIPIQGALVVVARRAATWESASMRRAQIAETRTGPDGAFDMRLVGHVSWLKMSDRFVLIALAPGYQAQINDYPAEPFDRLVVRLASTPSDGGAAAAMRPVVERAANLYADLPLECILAEVPELMAEIALSGAIDPSRVKRPTGNERTSCEL